MNIRPTVPADTPILVKLTDDTTLFRPREIVALQEVLDDYHSTNKEELGHRCFTGEEDGKILGFVYHAPAAMTDRTWHLWWIVVRRDIQAKGIGGALLAFAENDIRSLDGRVLFIETGSMPHYELTRKFYLKHGYIQDAVLKDFYADGDSMVVFRKAMSAPVS